MKKATFYFVLLIASLRGFAVDNAYREHMARACQILDSASVEKSLLEAAGLFTRVAAMHTDEWLPHYYAAYCYARISHLNREEHIRDSWVDRAQAEIDLAAGLTGPNSEILVMKGFVLQARMDINPMSRGFKYNNETMRYFNEARAIDPENPRAYLWLGVNLIHTPAAFGGGKDKGCPLIQTALEKFGTFVPADELSPDWGREYAGEVAATCN